MSVKIVLSEPWEPAIEELGLAPVLELGPFERVSYENGWWMGDGVPVAQVFHETIDDMMIVTGHPLADYTLVPRTFRADEHNDPEYPGKPYDKVEVMAADEPEPTEEDIARAQRMQVPSDRFPGWTYEEILRWEKTGRRRA